MLKMRIMVVKISVMMRNFYKDLPRYDYINCMYQFNLIIYYKIYVLELMFGSTKYVLYVITLC